MTAATQQSLNQSLTDRAKENKANGPATRPQIQYILDLIDRHTVDQIYITRISKLLDAPFEKGGMRQGEASEIINWLKSLPWKTVAQIAQVQTNKLAQVQTKPAAAAPLPIGLYKATLNGFQRYFRVRQQARRATFNQPASKVMVYEIITPEGRTNRAHISDLVKWRQLPDFQPVTVDEAKELTRRFKRCMICGRKLKVDESIDRGIGPVCFNRQAAASAFTGSR